jgi:hypothetical protein
LPARSPASVSSFGGLALHSLHAQPVVWPAGWRAVKSERARELTDARAAERTDHVSPTNRLVRVANAWSGVATRGEISD